MQLGPAPGLLVDERVILQPDIVADVTASAECPSPAMRSLHGRASSFIRASDQAVRDA